MTKYKWMVFVAGLSILAASETAHADALSAGDAAFQKGDVAKAVEKWIRSPKAEAAFRIAALAEDGRLTGCDAVTCAATWYAKAASAGHVPALTHLAILNFNNGHKEVGLSQFTVAARYNETLARDLLQQMNEPVPEPDLYWQAIEAERQNQIARQAALEQSHAQAAQIVGYLIGCGFGNNCGAVRSPDYSQSTIAAPEPTRQPSPPYYSQLPARAVASTPSPAPLRLCPDDTYSSGNCTLAPNGEYMGRQPGIVAPNAQTYPSQRDLTRELSTPTQPQARLCPDGTYVNGTCKLAPDGSYVGGQARMAPDGSYVSGTPRLAPNGTYVGGTGQVRLCPDGTYVGGARCRLMPNGQYIGE